MYQVLARKLRPAFFSDVVGQEHITKSLQNSILNDKIGHAYIFSGTRGVGKTTVARIFAKAIRCEDNLENGDPCGKCRACLDMATSSSLDLLEIDGASNNSVDDIRNLVQNVQYLPSFGKYKVYIIDEVHMLSTSAFNALLKTLEEPPAHVIFIFATTEPSKLLDTVLSRCQHYDFLSASIENLLALVEKISLSENIRFDNKELITKICEAGNESFRDTLSLLDQVLSFSEDGIITEDIMVVSLGLARLSVIKSLVLHMLEGNIKDSSRVFRGLLSENISLMNISKAILDNFYDILQNWNKEPLIDNMNLSEVYWVYETFAKEINWNLDSLAPKKTTELLIQKICLRRQVFKSQITLEDKNTKKKVKTNNLENTEKKAVELTQKVELSISEKLLEAQKLSELSNKDESIPMASLENKLESEETIPKEKCSEALASANEEKNWLNFLKYLSKISPASASTLEQGNLSKEIEYSEDTVHIHLCFTSASQVFLDYLQEEKAKNSLIKNLAAYFVCEVESINLFLELLDVDKAEGFVSLADINKQKDENEVKDRKKMFLTDPLIIEAERIFNSSIDKVILGKK